MTPGYFMVVTAGNAGTVWFAGSLDLHPDIKCTNSFHTGKIWSFEQYETIRKGGSLADRGTAFYNKMFENASVDEILDIIGCDAKEKIIGEVHGLSVGGYLQNIERFGKPKKNIVLATIARHPVSWMEARINRNLYIFGLSGNQEYKNKILAFAYDFLTRNKRFAKDFSLDLEE